MKYITKILAEKKLHQNPTDLIVSDLLIEEKLIYHAESILLEIKGRSESHSNVFLK